MDRVIRASGKVLGKDNIKIMPCSALGSDDFSFLKEKKPGVFIWLGAHTPGGPYGSFHTTTFYSDPAFIPIGMKTIISVAADYLGIPLC